jgi:hypothetical protein
LAPHQPDKEGKHQRSPADRPAVDIAATMAAAVTVEDELAGAGAPAILAATALRHSLDVGGEPHGLDHQISQGGYAGHLGGEVLRSIRRGGGYAGFVLHRRVL